MKAKCRCGGDWECTVTTETTIARAVKCFACGTADVSLIASMELSVSRDFVTSDHPESPVRHLMPAPLAAPVAVAVEPEPVRPFDPYEQIQEPVEPPPGFGRPRYRIGERVQVVFTLLGPKFQRSAEGKLGVVSCVVFCKSDGETILYGVRYDQRDETNGTGGRFESFEIERV